MRIDCDYDDEVDANQSEKVKRSDEDRVVSGTRFVFDQNFIDDDEESEFCATACFLDGEKFEDEVLLSLKPDIQFWLKENIRNEITVFKLELMKESQKYVDAIERIQKYIMTRKEADKKLDMNYKRKIAEALDNHITTIQRNHELKSQIQEKKIQSDATEARRREKALEEERLLKEAMLLEKEKIRAEEAAKLAALDAAKEAAEREALKGKMQLSSQPSSEAVSIANERLANSDRVDDQSQSSKAIIKKIQKPGEVVIASENALNLEQNRMEKLINLEEENNSLVSSTKLDFSMQKKLVFRLIKQISGVQEIVRTKANEIIKIITNSSCPRSISVMTFAEKVVSICENPGNSPFAIAYVIVLVASKVPEVLDIVLAEIHRACIYTVPKHIIYSQSVFESKDSYYKQLGYRQLDGKMETTEKVLARINAYMSLYGALVQTEGIPGYENLHGPKAGWAWLARFLNKLPANRFTGVALTAFLKAAGFALFQKYKSQFRKILCAVRDDFLTALKKRNDSDLNPIVLELQSYIDDGMFTKEPEGRQLKSQLLSSQLIPE